MFLNEIKRRFPNASSAFIRTNLSTFNPDAITKLEPDIGNAPLEKEKVQRPSFERVLVRVTSIRKRLCDEDNLCEKFIVDLCRYSGIIPDDSPDKVKIEVCQRKSKKGEEESTVIEVFRI